MAGKEHCVVMLKKRAKTFGYACLSASVILPAITAEKVTLIFPGSNLRFNGGDDVTFRLVVLVPAVHDIAVDLYGQR